MRDFKTVVDEVAGIGSSQGSSDSPLTGSDQLPPPPSTSRTAVQGKSDKGRAHGSMGAVGWSDLQKQMSDISARWANARRDARAAVFGCVSVHPRVSPFTRGASSQTSSGREGKNDPKAKKETRPFRAGQDMSFTESSSLASDSKFSSIGDADRAPSGEYQYVQLRKVWGATSPLCLLGDAPSAFDRGGESVGEDNVSLHLSRVHALQKDLAKFSQRAFELTHSWPAVESGGGVDPRLPEDLSWDRGGMGSVGGDGREKSHLSSLQADVRAHQSLSELRATSREMLLHCSALAPLAPLAANAALSGLEQFVQEVRVLTTTMSYVNGLCC
jgi:hypothetical protein